MIVVLLVALVIVAVVLLVVFGRGAPAAPKAALAPTSAPVDPDKASGQPSLDLGAAARFSAPLSVLDLSSGTEQVACARREEAYTPVPTAAVGSPRSVMLLCAANSACRVAGELVVNVVEARFATTVGGALSLCADPDPTCVFALGGEVEYALTAPVIFRGVMCAGLVVVVRTSLGYARVDGGACTFTPTAKGDAYWWVIARDATGAVYDASRQLLRDVAAFVPQGMDAVQQQPVHIPGEGTGTRLTSAACPVATGGNAACEAGPARGACVYCDTRPKALCELAAVFGACSAYARVCAVSCAVNGEAYAGQELFSVAADAREALPIFAARVPMFKRTKATPVTVLDPPMSALNAAVASGRWLHAESDPAVAGADRAYFWSVLRAMCERRMPYGDGYGRSEPAHGGYAPNCTNKGTGPLTWCTVDRFRPLAMLGTGADVAPGDAGWVNTPGLCKAQLHASSERAGGVRYLNFARMLGTCDSTEMRSNWYACTNSEWFRGVTGIATKRRAMTAATRATTASCLVPRGAEATAEYFAAQGAGAAGVARATAFLTGDYAALGWDDVRAMFGLVAEELATLKAALSPLSFSLAARDREFLSLSPRQRLELVARWNAGCSVVFGARTLQMPRGCGVAAGTQTHFPPAFVYGFWPSDLATRQGQNTRAAGDYTCVRCAAGGTTSVVQEESVACKQKEGYWGGDDGIRAGFNTGGRYDGNSRSGLVPWQRCDAASHPDWPGDNGAYVHGKDEGDGTYYEDGPDTFFFHGMRLDDGLTNYVDASGAVARREKVAVCGRTDFTSPWFQDGRVALEGGGRAAGPTTFPWAPHVPYDARLGTGGGTFAESPFLASPFRNTECTRVVVAPGFAVYVTPHYHGYHASTRTCHHGLPRLQSVPRAAGGVGNGEVVHVEQCRVGSWTPQRAAFKDAVVGEEPYGFVLVNDDLGSAWEVARGDMLVPVVLDESHRDFAVGARQQRFPDLVNCVAAWNYAQFPRHWLQRANVDPSSGDALPTHDVVAGADNNVRSPTDSVTDFVAHNTSLGALTVFRTVRLFDVASVV